MNTLLRSTSMVYLGCLWIKQTFTDFICVKNTRYIAAAKAVRDIPDTVLSIEYGAAPNYKYNVRSS